MDGGVSSELKVGSCLQKTNWMEDRFSDEGQLRLGRIILAE